MVKDGPLKGVLMEILPGNYFLQKLAFDSKIVRNDDLEPWSSGHGKTMMFKRS